MITHIYTKEQFLKFNERFLKAAAEKSISSSDMIMCNIIRGKDVRNGFTPITNQQKLCNGANEWHGFNAACAELRFRLRYRKGITEKFGVELTEELATTILTKMGA